ncbi:7231_t:CDS:2 [Ambispora gerdemannii]|uniref:7231_t:CDS:1 n=1 Tax=Ambispora gerdemannii TaxID=144530 RepID=A0A9N9G341_9GLOM|nr:7231_t:CDS:2 [Ambispora gerdemannii]
MTSIHGPSIHEFTINNILNVSTELYCPPFATSSEMFWQLRFVSESTKHPQYCELFLFAIPNEHERKGQVVWERRNSCAAYIYIKHPTQGYIAKKAIEKSFSCAEQSWGSRKFCKRSLLSSNIIIGVEFDKCQTSAHKQKSPFPPEPTSKDLVKAWHRQLNNPQMADLKLVVQGQAIYASSCILSARSEYFCQMLKGSWMEAVQSEELRSICYLKIMDELTVDDAAEILFSSGWKWDDLKADLMKFVVKNFTKVRETPGFYQIMQNSTLYPNFAEILGEIHSSLIPSSQ